MAADAVRWEVRQGDALERLREMPDGCVQCVVTSPPYFGLRDYGADAQLGLEASPDEFVMRLVEVFREVRRVLRDDGTVWLNIGDSYVGGGGFSASAPSTATSKSGKYGALGALKKGAIDPRMAGAKAKDLLGVPWMLAFALRADGWYLRSEIVWSKPNPMPESVTDRPTSAHEKLFLLSKQPRYFYDAEAIREPASWLGPNGAQHSPYAQGFARRSEDEEAKRRETRRVRPMDTRGQGNGYIDWSGMSRNRRNVWEVPTQAYPEAHFATFPTKLVEPCVLAGSSAGSVVLDPFAGSGTVGVVCRWLGREFVGIELNPEYVKLAEKRITVEGVLGRPAYRPDRPGDGQLQLLADA